MSRLAQNGCPRFWARHFAWEFSRQRALVICRCEFRSRRLAQNHKTVVPVLGRGVFLNCSCHISMCMSTAQARANRLSRFSFLLSFYHDLARISCCTFEGRSDIWRSWPRSCGDPCEKMLWRSWWNPATDQVLAWSCTAPHQKILWGYGWHSLGGVQWSRTGPYKKILWRSWWFPLSQVLAWSCCSGPCQKILWRSWSDPL